ncbi:MAG: uL15 family ribosomal protein [Candidatus Micrarchaeales archaeon]
MVLRREKKNRKYLGTRRWGMGNIKNARGAGGRGGVGEIGRLRKHDWTYITAKAPEMIRKKGFTTQAKRNTKEINLNQINEMVKQSKEARATLEFRNYKVLSNGNLEKAATIKAAGFSKLAAEKIKRAGGEAIVIADWHVKAAPKPQETAQAATN